MSVHGHDHLTGIFCGLLPWSEIIVLILYPVFVFLRLPRRAGAGSVDPDYYLPNCAASDRCLRLLLPIWQGGHRCMQLLTVTWLVLHIAM